MRILDGKTVAVTGGGGGLGRCYGMAMAKAGAAVAVSDINLAAAQATAEAIVETGGKAIALQADVTQAGDFEKLLDRTEAELGPLDVLLNLAGMYPKNALVDLPEDEWDATPASRSTRRPSRSSISASPSRYRQSKKNGCSGKV